ncbi:GGDEF domain protein [Patulibacter medicamentivorans]|uniref:GGDEF domain protein n=1 Tax=Patulibacter medicamentivorans TaxID=1097667 RepID=H0E6W7_9ACTN|nr:response regulator [Patulibacter medicamentivorans]EHN10570.1 GGDEF domain protein [Patulibacter medicamentivorans]
MSVPPALRASAAPRVPSDVRVLIADDDQLSARSVARVLGARGFRCEIVADGATALDAAVRGRPDILLLDAHMTPVDGFEVLARLQEDHRTALLPVIVVTGDRRPETLAGLLSSGADDYVTKPVDVDELEARILAATRRRIVLGGVSPLTGLPGNVLLTRAVQERLDRRETFGFLHVDLDDFKPFNDRYGYVRGDAVIRGLASVLLEAADAADAPRMLLGHIGGDDFGVLTPAELAMPLAEDVVARFDRIAPGFHDPEDVGRGAIAVRDRRGDEHEYGLISVSIGVTIWTPEHLPTTEAVADAAAEVKRLAKSRPGSQVALDRRRPGADG